MVAFAMTLFVGLVFSYSYITSNITAFRSLHCIYIYIISNITVISHNSWLYLPFHPIFTPNFYNPFKPISHRHLPSASRSFRRRFLWRCARKAKASTMSSLPRKVEVQSIYNVLRVYIYIYIMHVYIHVYIYIYMCIYIYVYIYICIHLIKWFLRLFSTIGKRDPIHGERAPSKPRLLSKVSRVPIR